MLAEPGGQGISQGKSKYAIRTDKTEAPATLLVYCIKNVLYAAYRKQRDGCSRTRARRAGPGGSAG